MQLGEQPDTGLDIPAPVIDGSMGVIEGLVSHSRFAIQLGNHPIEVGPLGRGVTVDGQLFAVDLLQLVDDGAYHFRLADDPGELDEPVVVVRRGVLGMGPGRFEQSMTPLGTLDVDDHLGQHLQRFVSADRPDPPLDRDIQMPLERRVPCVLVIRVLVDVQPNQPGFDTAHRRDPVEIHLEVVQYFLSGPGPVELFDYDQQVFGTQHRTFAEGDVERLSGRVVATGPQLQGAESSGEHRRLVERRQLAVGNDLELWFQPHRTAPDVGSHKRLVVHPGEHAESQIPVPQLEGPEVHSPGAVVVALQVGLPDLQGVVSVVL